MLWTLERVAAGHGRWQQSWRGARVFEGNCGHLTAWQLFSCCIAANHTKFNSCIWSFAVCMQFVQWNCCCRIHAQSLLYS